MPVSQDQSDVALMAVEAPVELAPGQHGGRRRRTVPGAARPGLEVAALAAAPLLAFLLLRVRAMAVFDVIDETIYSGLAQGGPDLLTRLGPDNYYWVRLGFLVPARLSSLVFGPVGGFYVLRYVLALVATVPLYLLLRRLHGRAAGAVAVALVLTSPVTWTAWGSDYPDSAALSYLLAGSALLVLPCRSRRRRLGVVAAAGALLAAAVHCQAVAALLVLPVIAGWLLVHARRDRWRATALEAAVVAAAGAALTVVLVLIAWVWLGHWDIFRPTYRAYRILQTPEQQAMWHTADWHWALGVPYVAVPVVVAVAYAVVLVLGRSTVTRAELALALGAVLTVALATYEQFVGSTGLLEYRLYSSMLWSAVLALTTLVVVRVLQLRPGPSPAQVRGALPAVVPAALVVVVAAAWSTGHHVPELHHYRSVALLGVLVVLGAGTVVLRRPAVGAVGVTVALVSLMALTTADTASGGWPQPVSPSVAQYGDVFGDHQWSVVDQYALGAQVQSLVPAATGPGQKVVTWWSNRSPQAVLQVSGRFQFVRVVAGLPTAATLRQTAHDLARLAPAPLLMMGADDQEFQPFLDAFRPFGTTAVVQQRRQVRAGGAGLAVWVVQFSALGDPCPGASVTVCPPA